MIRADGKNLNGTTPWSDEQVAGLVEGRKAGMSIAAIGRKVGRSPSSCYSKATELGLIISRYPQFDAEMRAEIADLADRDEQYVQAVLKANVYGFDGKRVLVQAVTQ
jgi:hypothetical protein